jgi:hypothetical protein
MSSMEFTVDNLGFASSALNPSQRKTVEDIAKSLTDGTNGVPRLEEVERIVLTGFSSGTQNLERHANDRAAAVRQILEGCLRNLGAAPVQLALISIADPVTKLVASAAQSSGQDRKVVIAIFSKESPARVEPGLDLVFVTQGDTRPVVDNRDEKFNPIGPHTSTELWQLRAKDLPKTFDGVKIDDRNTYPLARTADGDLIVKVEDVNDVTGAQDVIRKLDRDIRLRNVFFLGHGSGTEGFLFSGRPSGPGILDGMTFDEKGQTLMLSPKDAADQKFMDDNKRLFQAIAGRLAPGHSGIWFLACFVGLSQLHKAVAEVLSQQGRKEFFVGAYNNFYHVQANGEITGTMDVQQVIDGKEFTSRVPRMRRFDHWNDQIVDKKDLSKVLIKNSGPNRIPRFEVLDGRGQFLLDFLAPKP